MTVAPTGGIKHFWYELRDDEGDLRTNTPVNVYESVIDDVHYPYPAATEVNLYNSTNTTTLNQPILTTSAGILEFYIRDDMWPSGGYGWDDRIRIQWQHEGTDMYADRVMLWGEFYPVDETDTNTNKNKAMSNQLACQMTTHIDLDLDAALPSSSSSSSVSSSSSSSSSSISSSSSSSSTSSSSSSSSASATMSTLVTSGGDNDGYIIYGPVGGASAGFYDNTSVDIGSQSSAFEWISWFRFVLPVVPSGAIIQSAVINMDVDSGTFTGNMPSFNWYFEDEDDAVPFVGAGNSDKRLDYISRSLTTAFTTSQIPSATSPPNYEVDVTDALQEVINRPGWTAGNRVCILQRINSFNSNGFVSINSNGSSLIVYWYIP